MDVRDGEMERRMGTADTSPLTSMGWSEVQVRRLGGSVLTADSLYFDLYARSLLGVGIDG